MIVTIRGKRWRLRFGRLGLGEGNWGHCDPPTKAGKELIVRPGLSEQNELDTVIHEILHAGLWDLKEDAVNELATDLARALIRLGWRKSRD